MCTGHIKELDMHITAFHLFSLQELGKPLYLEFRACAILKMVKGQQRQLALVVCTI